MSRLERLATLLLTEQSLLLIYLATPELHIQVLWGVKYLAPSFIGTTPEDGKVLAFAQDFRIVNLPTTGLVKQ